MVTTIQWQDQTFILFNTLCVDIFYVYNISMCRTQQCRVRHSRHPFDMNDVYYNNIRVNIFTKTNFHPLAMWSII